ncbi:MlaA family lipoprotein [Candidatus Symbiobacter mobilis]|uniref:Lipoprotein n=1 Tax=Candidatus Symbiobacter mobilis CR TaxID=946483 RepID=U5N4J5_9BURK|nr:VacJ family lipoprotein [Candidatus Symbiobacter mobilis]AGX86180.1 lipoprotein [Candidatus Symbiobacter mobilis CR]
MESRVGIGAILVAALWIGGCATPPQAVVYDPWESWNRSVYRFNDAMDRSVLRPVASAYRDTVPQPVRSGVGNFFDNVQDLWSALQHGLQGRGQDAATSALRFGVNTTLGVYGVLDVATAMNLDRQPNDFGRTLGEWGVGEGPYMVLPFFGPSTLRDTAGLAWDRRAQWMTALDHVPTRNATTVLYVAHRRAQFLDAMQMLDEVALDPYAFTRDVYVQRRRSLSTDGGIPPQDDAAWDAEDLAPRVGDGQSTSQ